MTQARPFPADSCPPDLLCYGECWGAPAGCEGARVILLRLAGAGAVGLALAGTVLPLLPTTPFLLVAAWAFARSSPRLDAWLHAHPRLGPPLAAWEARRAIPRGAKLLAGVTLPAGGAVLWVGDLPAAAAAAGSLMILGAGAWIFTRPS